MEENKTDITVPNVWRAWSKEHLEAHYLVGHFDPATKTYSRKLSWREQKEHPGKTSVSGNFSQVCQHRKVGKNNYDNARAQALGTYFYSLVAEARENLGDEYGVRKVVIE